VLFGNPVGRLFTLYLLLPVLVGAGTIFFLDAMFEESHKYLRTPAVPSLLGIEFGAEKGHQSTAAGEGEEDGVPHRRTSVKIELLQVALVGGGASLFAFGLIHSRRFRRAVWATMRLLCRGARWLLIDLPTAFLRLGFVRAILASRAAQILW